MPGRPGHAELAQPDWRDGGAVNAIEKASVVLDAIRGLREEWRTARDLGHPYLSPPDVVPTMIAGRRVDGHVPGRVHGSRSALFYLPQQADDAAGAATSSGRSSDWIVRRRRRRPLARRAPADDRVGPTACMPMEIPPDEAIVGVGARGRRRRRPRAALGGLDSWYDGATFTLLAGTPSIAFGPAAGRRRREAAHTIDEYVLVDDLVALRAGARRRRAPLLQGGPA